MHIPWRKGGALTAGRWLEEGGADAAVDFVVKTLLVSTGIRCCDTGAGCGLELLGGTLGREEARAAAAGAVAAAPFRGGGWLL